MAAIVLIIVAVVIVVGLAVSVWLRQRRTLNQSFDRDEAAAYSAYQQRGSSGFLR